MRLALVMHSPLGSAFNDCAAHILGNQPELKFFDILPTADPATEVEKIYQWICQADTNEPIIILCDLFGATPFNIATKAHTKASNQGYKIDIFTGANLCMLLKALTANAANTDPLVEKIYQSAQRGIVKVDTP